MIDANVIVYLFNNWLRLQVWNLLGQLVLNGAQPTVRMNLASSSAPTPDPKTGELVVDPDHLRLIIEMDGKMYMLTDMMLGSDWDWIGPLPPPFHISEQSASKALSERAIIALPFKDQLLWMCHLAYSKALEAVAYRRREKSLSMKPELFDAHKKMIFIDNPDTLDISGLAMCFFSLSLFTQLVEGNANTDATTMAWPDWKRDIVKGTHHFRLLSLQQGIVKAVDHPSIVPSPLWDWVEAFDMKPAAHFIVAGVANTHVSINDSIAFLGTVMGRLVDVINNSIGVEMLKRNPNLAQQFSSAK